MERREQGVRKGQGGRRGAIWTREVQEQRLREREREREKRKSGRKEEGRCIPHVLSAYPERHCTNCEDQGDRR